MKTTIFLATFFGMIAWTYGQELGLAKKSAESHVIADLKDARIEQLSLKNEAGESNGVDQLMREFVNLYQTKADASEVISYLQSNKELKQYIESNPMTLYKIGMTQNEINRLRHLVK